MKQFSIFSLLLLFNCSVFSQDCFDKIAKQAVIIDSLQKFIKIENKNHQRLTYDCQKNIKNLNDSLTRINSDLLKVEKFKLEKLSIEKQIIQKNDSITSLKNQVIQLNQQISSEKQKCIQQSIEENEKGKNEALAIIVNSYKSKTFDELILTSTKQTIQRDMIFVGNNASVKLVLSDLEKYFNAEEVLANKFDSEKIKYSQAQLIQVKQQSKMLDKLKENIDFYKDYNDALKKSINNLIKLDTLTKAKGEVEIQKLKFKDISAELINYIYNFYNYDNYLYLYDIVLVIIKRKKLDADADINDLLKKL